MTDYKQFIDAIKAELTAWAAATGATLKTQQVADVVEGLLHYADVFQRRALKDCNEGLSEAEKEQDRLDESRVRELCKPYGIIPRFSDDPRGACLKVHLPLTKRGNSFGERDWYCVPSREY